MTLFSVSGKLNDLKIVGIDAKRSAAIASIRAAKPVPVTIQSMIAAIDKVPQIISILLIFQYAFLFLKEARNTIRGPNPATNVRIACHPTPSPI